MVVDRIGRDVVVKVVMRGKVCGGLSVLTLRRWMCPEVRLMEKVELIGASLSSVDRE